MARNEGPKSEAARGEIESGILGSRRDVPLPPAIGAWGRYKLPMQWIRTFYRLKPLLVSILLRSSVAGTPKKISLKYI